MDERTDDLSVFGLVAMLSVTKFKSYPIAMACSIAFACYCQRVSSDRLLECVTTVGRCFCVLRQCADTFHFYRAVARIRPLVHAIFDVAFDDRGAIQ